MKRTVRFVSDTEGYSAGDFGDNGEEEMARIAAGVVIVVGMVVFDADAADEVEARGLARETAVFEASIESLWCIAVQSDAINDCDRDITDPTTISNDYLRHLATEALEVE